MDNLTGLIASLKATSRAVDALLDQLIEEHKILNVDEDDDKKDFLHILLKLRKEGMLEIELTQDNLKAVILVYFCLSFIAEYPITHTWLKLYV